MSKKLVLIDAYSIMHRAFYGLPELTDSEGLHTNAILGFLNIMFRILDEEDPDYLAVAFDTSGPTFRHRLYPDYKGTRKVDPIVQQQFHEQVPVLKELLCAMNIQCRERDDLEADDILGTLAKKAERDGLEVCILSGDRDLLQIASDHIKVRIPKTKKGGTQIEDYYAQDVVNTYKVTPEQFIDLKALMGDTSDNVPGVPKIGQKTATDLILEYGSLDNIYAHVNEIGKKSIRESLIENKDLADLSKILVTIVTDSDIEIDYEEAKAEGYYTKEAYDIIKRLEFKSLFERFEGMGISEIKEKKADYGICESAAQFEDRLRSASLKYSGIDEGGRVGFWSAWEASHLTGAAVCLPDGETFCVLSVNFGDDEDSLIDSLQEFSGRLRIATFDIKKQYAAFKKDDTDRYFDILIGAYLLNPLKSDYDVESIAGEHLGEVIPGYAELFGKMKTGEALSSHPEEFADWLCTGAVVSVQAADVLEQKLCDSGMDRLMREIEMPLSLVLYDMEKEGVRVDREELSRYGQALEGRIGELEDSIHEQAGEDFNINSPKQLGDILFGKMKLPGGKKTKTGYSTAADVLEKLAPDYPIVSDILEYRGLVKLKSTYADGLSAYIGPDERIHTSYNQTVTATGRISSTEPNLQNIPMRTELGRRIRKVFIPKDGCVFVDADYSQIELRVLAHMSGDEQLIEAYRMDRDIHRITASRVFHVPFDEVTPLQRRNAKAVNFGIIYGISSFGLSKDLSISRQEASEYIDQYFEAYPGIRKFLDESVENAKKDGYATTMFGRRRPVPELSSSSYMQRSFGERVAMNSPIQGTAADIMKIAMIKVWRQLRDLGLKSRVILQVHDELVVETYRDEEEEVKRIVDENMREAADLKVELQVEISSGNDWYETK